MRLLTAVEAEVEAAVEAADKLVSEWQHVLTGATPAADQLHRLPYTAAVIAESMRLYRLCT